MKFLMVQVHAAPYCGTAYLNAAAKVSGHTFVLCLSPNRDTILEAIAKEKPDLIGFCALSCFIKDILALSRDIKKKYKIPIILGGPHPTLFPEVIQEKAIDIICRGEGEFAFVDLLNAMDKNKSYTRIKNLWVKKKKRIYRNPLRPLVSPLDKVPLIDWSCYKGTSVQRFGSPTVFLIRGCPFNCNYCFNQETRKMYHNLGPYIRHFSAQRSIQEIQAALQFFPPNPVIFCSDSFGIDIKWMEEVFRMYVKITKLPFCVMIRPELTTPECIRIFAKYKCATVSIGLESGSERVRRDVIQRVYSKKYLLAMAKNLHKYHIKFKTFNMIGLPTETEEEMWETVKINIEMKTTYPRAAIFTPFPGTKIVEIAKKYGYLDENYNFDDIPPTVLDRSVLKKLNAEYVQNMLFFFQTAVKFPALIPLIKILMRCKPNILFRLWFYSVYAIINGLSERRSIRTYIPYLYANLTYR